MEELVKKLKDAGKLEMIKSEEDLRAAAKELGYSDEDLDNFMSELPLDDDALEQAAGGGMLSCLSWMLKNEELVKKFW